MNKNIKKIVKTSSLFFFWGFRILPKAQREAMYTLYAFFHHINNIINGSLTTSEKMELIQNWREEIGNIYDKKVPITDIGRKIYKNCMRFKLPKSEFLKLIDSLAMNLPKPIQTLSTKDFFKYCRGSYGAPCNLSLRVIGCEDEDFIEKLSTQLGNAIEITCILKDMKEDAQIDRLYFPKDILEKAGILSHEPFKVLTDKNLLVARQELASIAIDSFDKSYELIEQLDKKYIVSAKALINTYRKLFDIMNKRGWEIISPKPKIGKISKMHLIASSLLKKKI